MSATLSNRSNGITEIFYEEFIYRKTVNRNCIKIGFNFICSLVLMKNQSNVRYFGIAVHRKHVLYDKKHYG